MIPERALCSPAPSSPLQPPLVPLPPAPLRPPPACSCTESDGSSCWSLAINCFWGGRGMGRAFLWLVCLRGFSALPVTTPSLFLPGDSCWALRRAAGRVRLERESWMAELAGASVPSCEMAPELGSGCPGFESSLFPALVVGPQACR